MLATPRPAVSPTRARSHRHGDTALAGPFGDPADVPGRADLPPERQKRVDLSLGPGVVRSPKVQFGRPRAHGRHCEEAAKDDLPQLPDLIQASQGRVDIAARK